MEQQYEYLIKSIGGIDCIEGFIHVVGVDTRHPCRFGNSPWGGGRSTSSARDIRLRVRERLIDCLRVKLTITEHCLDWYEFLCSPYQPSHDSMNLVWRILVPRRTLSNQFYCEDQRDVPSNDRQRRKLERILFVVHRPAHHRHPLDVAIVRDGRESIAAMIGRRNEDSF